MFKKNKRTLLITSLIILLPMFAGIMLWHKLPDRMATHFGAQGYADDYSSKAFAVFALPLILLAVQWLCVLCSSWDPKNKRQNSKVFGLVLWIIPVLSLFANGMIYAAALGSQFRVDKLLFVFLGLLFAIIGNYLPKCQQNYTIGIKIKWTLASEENWNATHRMAGKLWVVGGLCLAFCAFLPPSFVMWVMLLDTAAMVIPPFVYSYVYYKKQIAAGTAPEKPPIDLGKSYKWVKAVSIVAVIAILGFVAVLMFTGEIRVVYGDTSFTIEASYYADRTIDYADIQNMYYVDVFKTPSTRQYGFESWRLAMGVYESEELGVYTRYTYTKLNDAIVLELEHETVVINGRDASKSVAMFNAIHTKVKG